MTQKQFEDAPKQQALIAREETAPLDFYGLMARQPWMAMMPSQVVAPKEFSTAELQLVALEAEPSGVQQRLIGGKPFAYLGIDIVEPELHRIFGSRNVFTMSLPGYPKWTDGETKDGKPKFSILQHILLIVRYADGECQLLEGWGEHDYLPHNFETDRADAIRAAHSSAVTDAAKRLGRHFGAGLKQLVEGGLLDRIEAANATSVIEYLADGTRLFYDKDVENDVKVVHATLDDICQYLVNKPFAEIQGKEAVTVAEFIKGLPTLEKKETELDALRVVDPNIPDDITWNDLMKRKRELAARPRSTPAATRR